MLKDLHERLNTDGFAVVGIAIDDVEQARSFVEELGIEYPNLVGSTDVMATLRLYGNQSGVLPYSVLIDRNGIVRRTYMGVLDGPQIQNQIKSLLEEI